MAHRGFDAVERIPGADEQPSVREHRIDDRPRHSAPCRAALVCHDVASDGEPLSAWQLGQRVDEAVDWLDFAKVHCSWLCRVHSAAQPIASSPADSTGATYGRSRKGRTNRREPAHKNAVNTDE